MGKYSAWAVAGESALPLGLPEPEFACLTCMGELVGGCMCGRECTALLPAPSLPRALLQSGLRAGQLLGGQCPSGKGCDRIWELGALHDKRDPAVYHLL